MTLELTDRMVAIAEGRDPDALETEAAVTDDVTVAEGGTESPETQVIDEPQKPETDENKSWISDDVRTLAKDFGLDDAKLGAFTDETEFRRAVMLADQALISKPVEKKAEAPTGQQAETKVADIDLDPEKYKAAGYDEETIKLVENAKALKEQAAAQRAELEAIKRETAEFKEFVSKQREKEEAAQRERDVDAWHGLVDHLDEKLFGKSHDAEGNVVQLDAALDGNRRKLHEAAKTLVDGIVRQAEARGVEPVLPTTQSLLQRAKYLAFGEQIAKAEREAAQTKIRNDIEKQSKTRRPVASSRQPRTSEGQFAKKEVSREDVVQDILNSKDVQDFLAAKT